MKKITMLTMVLILINALHISGEGNLVIIGGALRDDNSKVYEKMTGLSGGPDKVKIAVISAASSFPAETGESIKKVFISYGVKKDNIRVFPFAVTDDPSTKDTDESQWKVNSGSAALAEEISGYDLIFFSGGDQSRLAAVFLDGSGNDTPVLTAIRSVFKRGGTIAGTSAGAAVMSDPMITSGTSISALTNKNTGKESTDVDSEELTFGRGFGFFGRAVIDQHFIKRGRIGRLVSVLHMNGKGLTKGIGIDEDTALIVKGNTLSVAGRSGVIVCDITEADFIPNPYGLEGSGIRVHYFHSGDSFDMSLVDHVIDPDRKPIETGKEYYKTYGGSTDVFGKDVFRDMLTLGLADCMQKEISGLGFSGTTGSNPGIRLTLMKTMGTRSFMGKINGEYTYSVIHAEMKISPVTVIIRENR